MNNMICIVGPTATGKTKLSVALCRRFDGEVVSCDSMQVYRRMDIGTAKPTAQEMAGIPHHMISVVEPEEPFSVGRYVSMADPMVQDILSRGKRAFLVGGTGLNADSLIAGRTFAPCPETGRRQELEALADREGIEAVIALLRTFDAESAERLHPSDRKRMIRAAEVYLETGKTITAHNEETRRQPPKYQPLWIGLNYENRQDLYDRIDARVDEMVQAGLFEEVAALSRLPESATCLQAIGYKEPLLFLRGEGSRQEAIEKIKQESRRYAKRQLTWFRRNPDIHWITLPREPDFDEVLENASQLLLRS